MQMEKINLANGQKLQNTFTTFFQDPIYKYLTTCCNLQTCWNPDLLWYYFGFYMVWMVKAVGTSCSPAAKSPALPKASVLDLAACQPAQPGDKAMPCYAVLHSPHHDSCATLFGWGKGRNTTKLGEAFPPQRAYYGILAFCFKLHLTKRSLQVQVSKHSSQSIHWSLSPLLCLLLKLQAAPK